MARTVMGSERARAHKAFNIRLPRLAAFERSVPARPERKRGGPKPAGRVEWLSVPRSHRRSGSVRQLIPWGDSAYQRLWRARQDSNLRPSA